MTCKPIQISQIQHRLSSVALYPRWADIANCVTNLLPELVFGDSRSLPTS